MVDEDSTIGWKEATRYLEIKISCSKTILNSSAEKNL